MYKKRSNIDFAYKNMPFYPTDLSAIYSVGPYNKIYSSEVCHPSLIITFSPRRTIKCSALNIAQESFMNSDDIKKNKLITIDYSLESFHRSNQDTSLLHKPAVFEGQWVESGDLIADCSTSVGGDLSLGQNILIGYMPWEGYNFEDAILISERLVYDDLYTSIHIEKYEIDIRNTTSGIEQLTREIPDLEQNELEHFRF